jgi:hypothetical protein
MDYLQKLKNIGKENLHTLSDQEAIFARDYSMILKGNLPTDKLAVPNHRYRRALAS